MLSSDFQVISLRFTVINPLQNWALKNFFQENCCWNASEINSCYIRISLISHRVECQYVIRFCVFYWIIIWFWCLHFCVSLNHYVFHAKLLLRSSHDPTVNQLPNDSLLCSRASQSLCSIQNPLIKYCGGLFFIKRNQYLLRIWI